MIATSSPATAAYIINLPATAAPTFSAAAGTYNNAQTVTIATTTAGAAIYNTTNGTTPTANSTKHAAPVKVTSSETLSAIAVATGWHDSRHTAYSRWVMRGIPLAAVAKYIGHSTIQMTMRYSHLVPKVDQAAVDVMDAFYAGGVGTETDTRTDTGTPASFPPPDK